MLSNITIPKCPDCNQDAMLHRCFSHIPGKESFKKNGWYCEECNAGPYKLGSMTEQKASESAKQLLSQDNK